VRLLAAKRELIEDMSRWKSNLAIAGLVGVGIYSIVQSAIASGDPGHYYEYRHSADGFTYPTQSVVTWSAIIAAQIALFAWLLHRTTTVARMAFVLGLIYLAQVFSLAIFAMHSPPYFAGFLLASFFGGAWLMLAWIITGIASLQKRAAAQE
jgi:hypothetical protein